MYCNQRCRFVVAEIFLGWEGKRQNMGWVMAFAVSPDRLRVCVAEEIMEEYNAEACAKAMTSVSIKGLVAGSDRADLIQLLNLDLD